MRHLFLDFDGVVSPYTPYAGTSSLVPCGSVGGFDISYLPDVVEWANGKITDPEWRVYLLSTWSGKPHHLRPTGLIVDEVAPLRPLRYMSLKNGRKWKPDAGIAQYNRIIRDDPDALVVWIDDEPDINRHPMMEHLVSVCPDPNVGLTAGGMARVDSL